NGTLLEQSCIFQGILAFFAMIYFAYFKDKRPALICCVFWLISVAAFCVLYFAPGTFIRMHSSYIAAVPITKRLINAAAIAFSHGLFTIIKFFVKPLVYVFLLFMPLIAKKIPASNVKLKIWQIIFITALISPLMQFLEGFGLGIGFPDRAVSLTLWCMGIIWCCLWSIFYRGKLTDSEKFVKFSKKYRYLFLIFALLISSNFVESIRALKIAPAYKAEYNARIQNILEQKSNDIAEPIVTSFENRPALIYDDFGYGLVSGYTAKLHGVENFWLIPKEFADDTPSINEIKNGNLSPLTKIAEKDMKILENIARNCDPMQSYNENKEISGGLEVSYQEAERWNRIGATHGNSQSMRSLSRLIYAQDKSLNGILRALYWLAKSQIATLRL
ncbi:MAG: hypothetical protein IJ859_02710, partial [Synergistaceae bacterium]|nr:hypothetical protein [Synergistaceae bacterium]